MMRPQPHAQSKKAHELVTTAAPETSGVPRAMGFRLASCSPRRRFIRFGSSPSADAYMRRFG
jgi:hypothetical protein